MKKLLTLFYESITDVTRRVDGKLLTIAAVAACVIITFVVGWVFDRWPPAHVWIPTLAFLAAALGIDAHLTSKVLEASQPKSPSIEIGEAENVNLPPAQ